MLAKHMSSLLLTSIILLISIQACKFGKNDSSEKGNKNLTPGADGVYYQRNSKGLLISSIEHKNGKRHGISRSYYDDGKTVHNEIHYLNNKKEGVTKSYYKSGRLKYIVDYVNNNREGIMKKYYESGVLAAEIPYKEGRPVEGLVEYYRNGKRKDILPHIVIETEDKTKTEGKYIIKVHLSNHKKKVRFYRLLYDKNNNILGESLIPVSIGVGTIELSLPKGCILKQKIKIKGIFRTRMGNPHVMYFEKFVSVNF